MTAWRIIEGDCLEAMAAMDAESVDAVVTDPPYGIGFMGKAWDSQAIGRAASKDAATRQSVGPHSPSRPGRKAARSSSAFGSPAHYAGPVRGGHEWQAWCEAWAAECLRVLKPGGHLLAFGGTRTYHRLTSGIEDAGFEIRDSILTLRGGDAAELSPSPVAWLYGSGRPAFQSR